MTIGRFLAGVGALIWDPEEERYLFLRRSAAKDFGAGAWECVTGRVDQGERFEQALRREVREELGIEIMVDFIIGTTHFYRGEPSPDNELLGIMYHCSLIEDDSAAKIVTSQEHDRLVWLTFAEAQRRFAGSVQNAWLTRTLVWAEEMRSRLTPDLLATFRARGFDINSQ